ncbi:MBL fold metallo-hydrolase [Deinococcus maricopensis]|uniref:Beta-lactamase domain protein n=1 Tax=Deinococcus maricopensis (strain DSM 21211 / LMG 22137 / NRRL B-23946 / LB-34) TaxID=709986 RepID=E8UA60_DEIML|nr:MBL fold metallo-hydrolase [Deinococcus maricopensis]ADV67949.1 beta-lactamase domain protein [Deinococcus maricopensis DSM 21211]
MLTHVLGTLHAVQVPIPYPMRTVTVLIDTARPVTLIDTALDTPEAQAAIEDALTALGLHWTDIERVIITHHHPDHYGLAGLIEERSGATIHMLDTDIARGARYWEKWQEWLPGHLRHFTDHGLPDTDLSTLEEESRRSRARVHPAARLTPLREGDTLPLAGLDWTVLWLPGHADGHLGLWHAPSSTLIAGDAILPRISPNVGLYGYSRPDPLGDYLRTLDTIARLDPRTTVVGHYGPTMEGAAERARQLTAHHHERLDTLEAAVRAQPRNAYDLSYVLFTRDLDASGRRFALAETLAHAEYLRLHGRLTRTWVGPQDRGHWVYGP